MTKIEKMLLSLGGLTFALASLFSTYNKGLYGGSLLMIALSLCLIKIIIDLSKYEEE